MSPASVTNRDVPSGKLKLKLARSMVTAMAGRVHRSRLRRPRVSIVQTAGMAPMKLMKPKTTEAQSAAVAEKPEEEKIVVE